MAKQSQLDRAIAQLEGEMAILQAAIDRLKAQRTPAAAKPRKPRTSRQPALAKVAGHVSGV